MLTVLVIILIVCVVLPYVGGPLLILFVHKQPAEPCILHLDPEQVRPELAGYVQHVAGGLASQGFSPAVYLWWPNPAGETDTQLLVFTNPSSRESAAAIDMCSTRAGAEHVAWTYLEFCTEFVNGESVCTNNVGIANITRPDPLKRVFHFPAVRNPLVLYGAHRRLVERHAPQAARFIPTPGTEHLHVAYSSAKAFARQVEFGYMYLDDSSGSYRPTLKGALLMSWKLLWPVKQVRAVMAKRKAAETLRSLGA